MTKNIDWPEFKSRIDQGNLRIQIIRSNRAGYYLLAFDENLELNCHIDIEDAEGAYLKDFETNYLNRSNQPIGVRDSDGSMIIRRKTTEKGWHYEPRSLDFFTSEVASLYNRTHLGNTIDNGPDYGDATQRFFAADGSEITGAIKGTILQSCVRTEIAWQSNYPFDIIGGTIQVQARPGYSAYIWSIIAPDIPPQFGGSVPFFAGGFNLNFFQPGYPIQFDGRGVKRFNPDPINNSNKILFVVKHQPGLHFGIQITIDQFKA